MSNKYSSSDELIYSFDLNPTSYQPSGSHNYSGLNGSKLDIENTYSENLKANLVHNLIYYITKSCSRCDDVFMDIFNMFDDFMIKDTNNIILQYYFDNICSVCNKKNIKGEIDNKIFLIIYDYCNLDDIINKHVIRTFDNVEDAIIESCLDIINKLVKDKHNNISIFATNYNVLRICSSMATLNYST